MLKTVPKKSHDFTLVLSTIHRHEVLGEIRQALACQAPCATYHRTWIPKVCNGINMKILLTNIVYGMCPFAG